MSWDDPGADLDHEVRYRPRGLQDWTSQVDAGFGTLDVEIRGLNPGTDHEAQVRAVNLSGTTSSWAPNPPLKVRVGMAPGAVRTVSATDSQRDGIAVSWTSPGEPGSGVRGYRVEWTDRSPVGGRFAAQAKRDLPSTQTSYTIDIAGLVKGPPYWVRVVPFNQVGDGEPSEAMQAVATSPPGPVSALSVESDNRKISLRWSPPLDDGGTAVTGYGIRYRREGTTLWSSHDHDDTGTSNAVTELTNGQRYEIQVRAVNSSDGGPWLSEFAVPSLEALRPGGTRAAPAGRGIAVSWQPPTKSGLTGYVVHWQTEPDQLHSQGAQQQSVPATDTSVLLADLVAGVQYRVRLETRFSDNSSGSSPDMLAAPVAEQSPLAAPSAVTFAVTSEDRSIARTSPTNPVRLVVTSTPPTPTASQPAVLFRELQWKFQSAGTYAAEHRVRIDNDAQRVDGFTLGQTYRLRVRAWNLDGPGAWHSAAGQSVLVAFTADPPQLHAPTPADRELALSWDPPSFTGGTAITGYRVQYRADGSANWLDHPHGTTSTTTTISGLANGTTYTVEVKAINAAGDSDPSTAPATPRTTPDAPRNLALTADDEEIHVDWKAPAEDGGARIQRYEIQYKSTTDTAFTAGPTVTPSSSDGPDATYRATIGGLTNGTTYVVEVAAANIAGAGSPAEERATPLSIRDQVRQKVESVVTAHEGTSPWLREAATHTDESGVPMLFLPAGGSTAGEITFMCVNYPTDLDRCVLDSYSVKRAATTSTVIHELAHVHTHINRYEADPGTIAISWLYLANTYGAGSGDCRIDEIVADGLTHSALPTIRSLTYWSFCRSTGSLPTAAERTVFTASVTGAIPDWFIDTYGGDTANKAAVWTGEYTGDTAAVWTDVMKLPEDPRTTVVRMMRNFFGGYCSVQTAEDAAFSNSGRASPWAAADCKPNPPTSVVLDRGATSLTLSWEPPETTPGGTATEHIVQWRSTDASDNEQYPDVTGTFGAAHRQVKITDLTTLSYEMTGLTADKTYAVRVRAGNASYASDWVEREGTVAVASAPQDFVVSAADGALSVAWSAPATNGGSAVTSYVLQWKAPGVTGEDTYSDTDRRAVITGLTDLTYSISSLTNGRSYTVRLYATTSLGNGNAAEDSATAGSPGTLQDVRVDPGTCSNDEVRADECTYSFTAHWDPPASGDGSGQITSFEIQWRPYDINNPDAALPWGTEATFYGAVTVDDGTATSYTAQPERLSRTELRVRALNGSLPGPWSDVFTFRPGRPTHVQNFSAVYDPTARAFNVSWEPPRFTGGNPVTAYSVTIEDCTNGCFAIAFAGHFHQNVSVAADARSYTLTRTPATGSTYIVYVRAITQDGSRRLGGTARDARQFLHF